MQLLYHVRRKESARKGICFSSRGLSGIICHVSDSKPMEHWRKLHFMQLLYHGFLVEGLKFP